ncbi:MAG: DUF2156 domain-containing protein [Chloroflexota bacterium]|nr:DUF2156 domain-containing protein [Chloroflexota bacterium]
MRIQPSFPEFAPLELAHKELLEDYTGAFPPYSDYTFASLWCWNLEQKFALARLNDDLIVRFTDYTTNEPFLSFFSKNPALSGVEGTAVATIDAMFAFLQNEPSYLPYLKLVPEPSLSGMDLSDKYDVVEDCDNHDYIYALEDLVTLSGGKYMDHRNLIHRFQRRYISRIQPLDLSRTETWQAVRQVCEKWASDKQDNGGDVENDTLALQRLEEIVADVKLDGIGVYVDGAMVGFSIAELDQLEFATAIFEKADKSYVGVFPFLRKQSAIRLKTAGFQYLNLQQDLGVPGLRAMKKSWRPQSYLRKFIIRQRQSHSSSEDENDTSG